MKKMEAKYIALQTVMESVGTAYYKICDGNDYSETEQQLIMDYIRQYGERIAAHLKTTYVSY